MGPPGSLTEAQEAPKRPKRIPKRTHHPREVIHETPTYMQISF